MHLFHETPINSLLHIGLFCLPNNSPPSSNCSVCEKIEGKYRVECVTDPKIRYSRHFKDIYANKQGLEELGICINRTLKGFEKIGNGQVRVSWSWSEEVVVTRSLNKTEQ